MSRRTMILLAAALGVFFFGMDTLNRRLRPFLGSWASAVNGGEFLEYHLNGEFVTGEGSGEMCGRWEVRGPYLLSALEGDELRRADAVVWQVSEDGKTLTLKERNGSVTTWIR